MGKKKNLDDLKANIRVLHNEELTKLKGGGKNVNVKLIKKNIRPRGCGGDLPH